MRLSEWRATGRMTRYRGHEIVYYRGGRGHPLVLIHGFPTGSWDWHLVWPGLVERFDVVAIDMIGFAFSAKPVRYDYSIMDQASLHEAVLHQLGLSSVHVLAHDYGDSVAQELLARQADGNPAVEIRSACLLNGGIIPGAHRPLPIQKLLTGPLAPWIARLLSKRTLRRSFDRIFGPETKPGDDEIDEFWTLIQHNRGRRVVARIMRYMAERQLHRERWVGALVDSVVPLRLINGLADPISGAHVLEQYRTRVPRPDTVGLERIGHYPQLEAPQAVLRGYLDFVESLPG